MVEIDEGEYLELLAAKAALKSFCDDLIALEDKEWKPMQCFRSDAQVAHDEARHELAGEIAEQARGILAKVMHNAGSNGPSGVAAKVHVDGTVGRHARKGTEMATIELTKLQEQRLKDVKDVVRWSMDGIQRKAERADENDRKTVTLSVHEAFNVLNVMSFISSLPAPPIA